MAETTTITIPKKKKGWFQKIPTSVLFSPGGMVLILFAIIMELIDLIPIPFIDQLWEIPFEIIFIIFFLIIVKDASFKSLVIPIILERIPILNDILPSFVIRMFI